MSVDGVTLGSGDRQENIQYGTLAEEEGLDSFWVGESWGRSSVPIVTQLIERTDTIDVCPGIFNVYSRTPALIAMTMNTLGDLSDGRVRVGMGTSGPAVIENFHGVDFDDPLRRTREYIELVRKYLTGERVMYDGTHFDVAGFSLDMEQFYECPIYVASMGEVNRQLTGEFADGWMPLLVPHTGLEDALEAVERGATRGDRHPDDIDVAPWVPTCISEENPEEARETVRSMIAFYVGAMGDYYGNVIREFGFGGAVEAINAGWEEDKQAGAEAEVTDEMLSTIGACGTPQDALASFEAFVDAGADSPMAYIPSRWASGEIIEETITHL